LLCELVMMAEQMPFRRTLWSVYLWTLHR
jgi:hypothetical protein